MPVMHMLTAREEKVTLYDALAALFFVQLHDRVEHNCMLKDVDFKQLEKNSASEFAQASSGDVGVAMLFGRMASLGPICEEWAYLSEDDIFIFRLLASSAVSNAQSWIEKGVPLI